MPELYWQLIFSLLGVVLVLILTFIATKWIAKRYAGAAGSGGKSAAKMQVLDRMTLGKDQYILIAKIYGGIYMIGVSGHQITLLKDLSECDQAQFEQSPHAAESFSSTLLSAMKQRYGQMKDHFGKVNNKEDSDDK